ncbi:hypothetical protein [Falsiroseomonas selenitidurans]|nr:hypothetical protein [Falsiroseomonas selenitidurans]
MDFSIETASGPRPTRRLTDKILLAFHQACDQGELEVARALLAACELAIAHSAAQIRDRRRHAETLCAAHERLWFLRNPQAVLAERLGLPVV